METDTMGRAQTAATIENLKDLWDAQRGRMPPDQVHRLNVNDALVDTGATLLSLPSRLIRQLGLAPMYTKRVTSSTGGGEATVYDAVRLTIQGRYCTMDVMEVPDDVPVLIGQLPLEHLDFVVEPAESDADRQSCSRRRTRLRVVLRLRYSVGNHAAFPLPHRRRKTYQRHSAESPRGVPRLDAKRRRISTTG
jgi:predicted aspartyl protease